jgi:diguanylate cyclase (GGDEF)-like protein
MRILVAEKDASVRSLIATRLKTRRYEVTETADSEEVLRLLERNPTDLILLSTEMERIGGKLVIEKIRQIPSFNTIPVILMTGEESIADLVMSQERGFDDFLIKPFNPLVLQLRVALNISRARSRVEANALTHLPGNPSIERVIRKKIESGEKFSVLYMDINHFKSFNDRYGFDKGDDVLRQMATLLIQTAQSFGDEDCFVGHIGGDDFIVVSSLEREEAFARRVIAEFDRIMPTYYNEADRKRGYIRATNRQGKPENQPLMSCSIAACNNEHRIYTSIGEIAQDAAEVKAFLKSQSGGSHYLRDRRSSPIREVKEALEILAPDMPDQKKDEPVDPLGRVLLNAGLINQDQLSAALKRHFETGQRLGQVLIAMNAVKSEDVGHMLEKKLNVPYVSLKTVKPSREMLRLFSMDFVRSHRVVPVEVTKEGLRLGMCDPFDLKTLDAIERITNLKPIPCLALEDEFIEFVERQQGVAREEAV